MGAAVGGGGDAQPTAVSGVTFDKVEATADFANQLGPPPAEVIIEVIMQTQGDARRRGTFPFIRPPRGSGGE